MEVTRRGHSEPCDKPATCVIRYQWEDEEFMDAACAYHAHQMGGALPITADIAAQIIQRAGDPE